MEAVKERLAGDAKRQASIPKQGELRRENGQFKDSEADLSQKKMVLKKAW